MFWLQNSFPVVFQTIFFFLIFLALCLLTIFFCQNFFFWVKTLKKNIYLSKKKKNEKQKQKEFLWISLLKEKSDCLLSIKVNFVQKCFDKCFRYVIFLFHSFFFARLALWERKSAFHLAWNQTINSWMRHFLSLLVYIFVLSLLDYKIYIY